MATTSEPEPQYNTVAPRYNSVTDLPCFKLEAQLIAAALGPCRGLKILDLGGGTGLHARRAVDLGASAVDLVDLSPLMLDIAQTQELLGGRADYLRTHVGDASKPLAGVGALEAGSYDVVMANWLFDHAGTAAALRGMWENVVAYLKPGGRFIGVRVRSLEATYMKEGRYGAVFVDIKDIQGGRSYGVNFLTEPAFKLECMSMEDSLSLTDDIPRQLRLVDFDVVKTDDMDVVKGDLSFWKPFLEEPNFAVVTARKES